MMVFGHSAAGTGAGGGIKAAGRQQQVWPVDYEAATSQRLVDAAERGDLRLTAELLADPAVDINYAGAMCVKVRRAEAVLREEAPDEVRVEYEELRTDVSPLFLAAHTGNLPLVRLLLALFAFLLLGSLFCLRVLHPWRSSPHYALMTHRLLR